MPHHKTRFAVAVILNLIIVTAPLVFSDIPDTAVMPVFWILAGSTLMCVLELHNTARCPETLNEFSTYQWAALAGSLLLLLTKWSSLLELLLIQHRTGPLNIVTGVLLVTTGCVLRSMSIRALADGFRSEASGMYLATSGIYAALRHPSEVGLLLTSVGFLVIPGSWRSALIFLPLSLIFSRIRTQLEERSLRATFAPQYAQYCSKTRAFLPHLNFAVDKSVRNPDPPVA